MSEHIALQGHEQTVIIMLQKEQRSLFTYSSAYSELHGMFAAP